MANLNDSREARKERLRQNIITNRKTGKGEKRPSPKVFILIIVIAAVLIGGLCYWLHKKGTLDSLFTGSTYTIEWSRSSESDAGSIETFKAYQSFAGGVVKYTKDGAEYIDAKGNVVWERSYQLNSPIIDVSSGYAVIGDQGSTHIYIFSTGQMTGSTETLLPISLVRIADNGVVYAVLNDSGAEYITAFRQDGSAIDLSVKSVVSGDGYPFDIDVSPDGTELITSYLSIDNGQINNNVVFRNFGSIGQNEDARRVVGGFKDEFAGHMAGYVHFSANEYSQAFYDGGVVFFSTEVLNSPEVLENAAVEGRIEAVACSDKLEALITTGDTDNSDRRLIIFNNKGTRLSETALDERYTDMTVIDETIFLRSGNRIRIYGKGGALKSDFEFEEDDVTSIAGSTANSLYIITGTDIYKVRV